MAAKLSISIVSYSSNNCELQRTLSSLLKACSHAHAVGYLESASIFIVDNGPAQSERKKIENIIRSCDGAPKAAGIAVLGDGANIGFGAGHNRAFGVSNGEFHLVLNPDVELDDKALSSALEFMAANPACGALAPAVVNLSGTREFLCKRYPTLFGLFLRSFAPRWLRQKYNTYLAHYEMRDMAENSVYWDPPIISGCFMLLRARILKKVGGFDNAYFLYFEDFDLSLRLAGVTRIVYVPAVKIMHAGGNASRKGLRHIWLFSRSAVTFFNRHGWKIW